MTMEYEQLEKAHASERDAMVCELTKYHLARSYLVGTLLLSDPSNEQIDAVIADAERQAAADVAHIEAAGGIEAWGRREGLI